MKQRLILLGALIMFLATGFWHAAYAVMSVTAQPTPEKKTIEYALPYPGVLPNHPLYSVKRLRDFILEQLISEPVKKAEFYVLQADKRLEMSLMLLDTKENALAETTASKAEKYMEKAVDTLRTYQKTNAVVPKYLVEKLTTALAKHEEVVSGMLTTAQEAQKNGLTESLNRIKQLQVQVKELNTTN